MLVTRIMLLKWSTDTFLHIFNLVSLHSLIYWNHSLWNRNYIISGDVNIKILIYRLAAQISDDVNNNFSFRCISVVKNYRFSCTCQPSLYLIIFTRTFLMAISFLGMFSLTFLIIFSLVWINFSTKICQKYRTKFVA